MTLSLTLPDLEEILLSDIDSTTPMNTALRNEIAKEASRLKELEDMDLDDCLGGACKL